MSATTRVNGSGQFLQGTIYSVAQLKAFLIDYKKIKSSCKNPGSLNEVN